MHTPLQNHPRTPILSQSIAKKTCRACRIGFALLSLVAITIIMTTGTRDASARERELTVATKHSPPFAMQKENGEWEGISIDLMRAIAKKQDLGITFIPMSLPDMIEAVAVRTVDIGAAALTMTVEREEQLDFSHPYFQSGLAIAVREKDDGWEYALRRLFSPAFLKVLGGLSLLLLLSGFLVWVFERRNNPDNFGGGPVEGIWSGFWWAAVTMTTVGYGDKAPKTPPGRIVALIWMFTSLVVISGFTAAMTTSLTVGSLGTGIRQVDDLYGKKVGTVKASTSSRFLDELAIRGQNFPTVNDALHLLEQGKLDAVVYDEPILRYLITTGEIHGIKVVNRSFRHEYYALALPPRSTERETLNRNLLEIINSKDWKEIRFKYLHNE
ncbi:transporter substrate-binding domain-containing protein [Chlorobium phaeovibrioides]|uniref:Transporter substrate-binding domain-containing protein n=1 Tax=Chlorobium phaeovibrioides TaxID=1094 RepID=A0ABW9UVP6_CHLPH|nr:transporter substrate-binding domain-containing protein [Chlorobium phaeovibrioides]MWV54916.1 transporter substrate-binding domain-containing protein [Chlorobium phaeovibrioides]